MDGSAAAGVNGANAPPTVSQPETLESDWVSDSSSVQEIVSISGPVGLSSDLAVSRILQNDLLHALDQIQPPGAFASFRALPATMTGSLGLAVDGVGTIDWPLQEAQARQIIEKARQAPYGKGEATIVDTSVRNTWELDTSQFTLQGTAEWASVMDTMIAHVGHDLGIADSSAIRAEPYKMLVYEKGAMFKAHTDSPKLPGMFGTLVIVLPSAHQGGDVVVKHQHEKRILRSSVTAQGGLSFMSWYSDVQHEVLPVTSGYRWVLTYNLAREPAPGVVATIATGSSVSGEAVQHLHGAIQWWLAKVESAGLAATGGTAATATADNQRQDGLQLRIYDLDHHYTEAAISLKACKRRDITVVQALRAISSELPVDIYLAILEKKDMGSCDDGGYDPYNRSSYYDEEQDWHEFYDIDETTFAIKKLVDLDGIHLVEGIDIEKEDILHPGCFTGADGEEIDFEEGYAGNEGGSTATHAYRVSGVVMVPRASVLGFLQRAVQNSGSAYSPSAKELDFKNLQSLVTYFSTKCRNLANDSDSLLKLERLCKYSWDRWTLSRYGDKPKIGKATATHLLQTLVQIRDWKFFQETAQNMKGDFDSRLVFAWIKKEIENNALPFTEVQMPLLQAFLSLPSLSDALAAVSTIVGPPPPQPDEHHDLGTDSLQEWGRTALEAVLDTVWSKELGYVDGLSVVRHCLAYHDIEYIRTRFVPCLGQQTQKVSFALGFLAKVGSEALQVQAAHQRQQWLSIYEPCATSLISAMSIPAIGSAESLQLILDKKAATREHCYRVESLIKFDESMKTLKLCMLSALESNWLPLFYTHLLSLKTETTKSLALELSLKVANEASLITQSEEEGRGQIFRCIWVPLLHQLGPILEDNAVPLSTPQYQRLFAAVLEAYLDQCVGNQPIKSSSLERPTIQGCNNYYYNYVYSPGAAGSSFLCPDCETMNAFLADPNQRVGRFRLNEKRRRHVHRVLDSAKIDCTHVTERTGSPYTLVVTKTVKQQVAAQQQWAKRQLEASKVLQAFSVSQLQALLGSKYGRIVNMDNIRHIEQPYASSASSSLSPRSTAGTLANGIPSSPLQIRTGTKRKAVDFVDLTEID